MVNSQKVNAFQTHSLLLFAHHFLFASTQKYFYITIIVYPIPSNHSPILRILPNQ